MSKAADYIRIIFASEFKAKGLNDAEKGIKKLSKEAKDLAKIFGVSLGAKMVADFGKASVKAFIDDQREATKLATVVKNLGLEMSNPSIAKFIDQLTLASGVSDNELRPALQALLTTTGSLTNSQKLLTQAVDISVGSGIDLATVSQDLANAYVGITKGLKKYNLGLTQAELKAASFAEIQAKLTAQFGGANADFLKSYAGQMQVLSNAAGEAQEKIGGALLDAMISLAGAQGVDGLISKIDSLATKTANWIDNFVVGLKEISYLTRDKSILSFILGDFNSINKGLQSIQVEAYNSKMRRTYMDAWANVKTPAQVAAEKKAEAEAKKRAKALLDAQNKQTKALKDQASLKKSAAVFDQKQIEIIAALKGKISEEDKIRLNLLLAIEQGNVAEAEKWGAKLSEIQKATMDLNTYLATFGNNLTNPFTSWANTINGIYGQFKSPTSPFPSMTTAAASAVPTTNVSDPFATLDPNRVGVTYYVNNNLQLEVNGSVVSESDLVDLINSGLNNLSLSGSPSSVGRFLGSFAA